MRSQFTSLLVLASLAICSVGSPDLASADDSGGNDNGNSHAVILKQVPPAYPPREHQRGIGGTVVIAFDYSAAGKVTKASVKTSSGNKNLDNAAVAAVKQWAIGPPASGGQPIAGSSEASLTFTP